MQAATLEEFQQHHLLGQGAYASTYFGLHSPTNLGVALKIYIFNEKNHLKEAIEGEVRILKKISHPNIVKLFQYFAPANKCILVLE